MARKRVGAKEIEKEPIVILFRQGRSAPSIDAIFDIEVAFDLDDVTVRSPYHRYAPWRPAVEVFETDADLIIRAEVGGIVRDDVHILVEDIVVRIRGERRVSSPGKPKRYHESRVRYGRFEAAIHLPFPVDVAAVTADYVDGFLTVTLPRLAAVTIPTPDAVVANESRRGEQ